MRQIYCCYDPYILCGSDLSGVEARMLGHFTSYFDGGVFAKELIEGDIHSKNAELIGRDRNTAKTFFYSTLYGSGPGKLSTVLGCSLSEAKRIIENFYSGNPGLQKLNESLKAFYKKHRYIKAINGSRLMIRSEHVLLNSLIQASSAVIFKRWGCMIWDEIDRTGIDAVICIAMHDEFQIRVHKNDTEKLRSILSETLTKTQEFYKVSVELKTDTRFGPNWRMTH